MPAEEMLLFRQAGGVVRLTLNRPEQRNAYTRAMGEALSAAYRACDEDDGVRAMAAAGTVAVLLPGAFYFLRETQLPPVQALRDAGVPIALASDHNPGSSPGLSLLLI